MENMRYKNVPVLIVGNKKEAFSIAVCLINAGHPLTLYTENKAEASEIIDLHFNDMFSQFNGVPQNEFKIVNKLGENENFEIAIVINKENLGDKESAVQYLENILPADSLILINSESIPLSSIQKSALHPARIIGVNWVEPAHTTYFLEIISNNKNNAKLVDDFCLVARTLWQKDPYVLNNDNGIRTRLLSALIREAFYLVENEYVSVEDIDRACRNDPGHYLPFAGNFRYMDLMGTYIYGIVMQDLNPELSKEDHVPAFFQNIIKDGGKGMENNTGFYKYPEGDVEKRRETFRKFSYQIREVIEKYPFSLTHEKNFHQKEWSSKL